MLKVKIIISLILYFLLTSHLIAEEPLVKYKTKLTKIENYLNNIQFLSSDFIQTSPEGDINYGKFYLSRPGKMRIEYDKEIPILIIVNNNILSYIDLELEEASNFSTGSTPASFLTRKTASYTSRCRLVNRPDTGIVRVISEE